MTKEDLLNKKLHFTMESLRRFVKENEDLGNYDTIEKAFSIYKLNKLKEIKRVADKWKDKIEPHVYQAMYNYQVEITTELNRISQYEI